MIKIPVFLTCMSLTFAGCATTEKSTMLGVAIGGVAGGAIGNAQDGNRDKSTMVGAAIGATLGGLIGYAAYKDKQKKQMPALLDKNPFDVPMITRPKVNCTLVEDAIEGNKWIEKHHVCIIESPSTWSR